MPTFDPFDASPDRDPQPALAELRASRPVLGLGPGVWYVVRHEDVRRVLLDPETYSSVGNFQLDEEGGRESRLIVQLDPPRHTALRRVLLGGFTRGAIRDAEPWITARLHELVDAFARRGRADLMRELALPLTSHVIARLVGVPAADAARLAGWVRDVSSQRPRPVKQLEPWRRLKGYLDALVERRRAAGPAAEGDAAEDMIARLLVAEVEGRPLGADELPYHVYQLFTAGTETTAYTIGVTVHELLKLPGAWQRLAQEPGLYESACEEGLRYASAIRHDFSTVTVPAEIAGQRLAPGDRVIGSVESANRDERVYAEPQQFRLDRREAAKALLAFGAGIHLCLGASLARAEIVAALRVLRERLPGLRLAAGWRPRLVASSVLNGLETLEVEWDATA